MKQSKIKSDIKVEKRLSELENLSQSLSQRMAMTEQCKTDEDEFMKVVDSLDKHRAISIYKDMQLYVDESIQNFKRDQKKIQNT